MESFPQKFKKKVMVPSGKGLSRGAFILLEGVDRCGKTTQCNLLLQHLLALGIAAVALRFPDRTTLIGNLINGYLQQARDMDDRAIHLLFSANRWEASASLSQTLANGITIVCDRYAYSGVAFSSAKQFGENDKENLSLNWCKRYRIYCFFKNIMFSYNTYLSSIVAIEVFQPQT